MAVSRIFVSRGRSVGYRLHDSVASL